MVSFETFLVSTNSARPWAERGSCSARDLLFLFFVVFNRAWRFLLCTVFLAARPSSTAPIQSGSVIGYSRSLPYRNVPNQSHASFGLSFRLERLSTRSRSCGTREQRVVRSFFLNIASTVLLKLFFLKSSLNKANVSDGVADEGFIVMC